MFTGQKLWQAAVRNLCQKPWQLGRRRSQVRRKHEAYYGGGAVAEIQVLEPRQLLSAGAVDTTYGTNGATAPTSATVFAMQANDECVTAGLVNGTTFSIKYRGGHYTYTTQNLQLTRYTTSGTIDMTYGSNGTATFSLGGQASVMNVVQEQVDSNGRILVFAQANTNIAIGSGGVGEDIVVRFNSNGTLDTTFGNKGIFAETTNVNSGSLAVDPQGRILLFADSGFDNSNGQAVGPTQIFRLNSSGASDNTFGTGGVVTSPITTISVTGIRLQSSANDPNGYKILFAAAQPATVVPPYGGYVLARLNSNGSLDTSFGTGGTTTVTSPIPADQLAAGFVYHRTVVAEITLEADGSFIATGTLLVNNSNGSTDDGCIGHYSANGVLDTSFGSGGFAYALYSTDYSNFYPQSKLYSARIDNSGNIVVSGNYAGAPGAPAGVVILMRFTATGQLDTTFGGGQGYILGPRTHDQTGLEATHLEIQSDGKLVIFVGLDSQNSLYRYLGS